MSEKEEDVTPLDRWTSACIDAIRSVTAASFEKQGDIAIRSARLLLDLALELKGLSPAGKRICQMCDGNGYWAKQIGEKGQVAQEPCAFCYGTGNITKEVF